MSTEYTLALVGLIPCVLALIALIWALMRRQVRAEDQEMYAALLDDDTDYSVSASRHRSAGWFIAAFIAISVLIGWMVVETVITARIAAQPTASQSFEKKE